MKVVVISTDTFGKFDKNSSEMGTESVARQMHQKTVQHYWVNIDKQQVMGGAGSHTQRHDNSTNGGGFESNNVFDTGTGTVRQSDWRAFNATQRRG